MKVRGIVSSIAVVLGVAVATAFAVGYWSKPSCGCSIYPTIREPALDAARAFHRAVAQTDPAGAWALLSPAAQARYGDITRFQPVADGLRAAFADPVAARWFVVAEWLRYSEPSEAAVVLYGTSPPRFIAAIVVDVRWGATNPDPHIDPEPARVDPTATPAGGAGVASGSGASALRIALPPVEYAAPKPAFLVLDTDGKLTQPVPDEGGGITVPAGPVVVIYAQRPATGWRVGVTPAGSPG